MDRRRGDFPFRCLFIKFKKDKSMNAKKGFTCGLLLSMLVAATARSEDAPLKPEKKEAFASSEAPSEATPAPEGPPGLSSYLIYQQAGCCGHLGGHGPILSELYLRTGPSFPLAGSFLSRSVETGWEIQGGGRSLFVNSNHDAAWVVDLGIGDIYNNGNRPERTFPILGNPVNVRDLNRLFVSFGLGREWYFLGPVNAASFNWRFGVDGGGRLGSARVDLNDPSQASGYRRLGDFLSGAYVACYSDVEAPCGCCTFLAGWRAEWDYMATNVIPEQGSDVRDLNFLLTMGLRF